MYTIGVAEGTSIYVFTQDMRRIMLRADELYERFCEGEDFKTFSCSPSDGSRHLTLISDIYYTGESEHDVLMFWLTPYRAFRCTPDTEVLMSDGTYTRASNIKKDDELMGIRNHKAVIQDIEHRKSRVIYITVEDSNHNYAVSEGDVILREFSFDSIMENSDSLFKYINEDYNPVTDFLVGFEPIEDGESDGSVNLQFTFNCNGEEKVFTTSIPEDKMMKLFEVINKK